MWTRGQTGVCAEGGRTAADPYLTARPALAALALAALLGLLLLLHFGRLGLRELLVVVWMGRSSTQHRVAS